MHSSGPFSVSFAFCSSTTEWRGDYLISNNTRYSNSLIDFCITNQNLDETIEEILELERLLIEARERLRHEKRKRGIDQSWWDWMWETLGY